jgi:hypothetical protein
MIIGAHSVVSSTNPEADGAFLRDVLGLSYVDAGGYLVFGLPPAEVSVHAADRNGVHELYLMCDDVNAFVTEMQSQGMVCDPVNDQGWGVVTRLTLPGGGKLGVYQPRYTRPKPMTVKKRAARRKRPPKRRTKKHAKKRPKKKTR